MKSGEPSGVSISVKLSVPDVRWATLQHVKHGWTKNRWQLLAYIAFWCVSLYLYVTVDTYLVHLTSSLLVTFLLVIPAFAFIALPWIQAVVSMRNPIMQAPFHHTFSESGISSRFAGGSVTAEWSLLGHAEETSRYIGVWGKRGVPLTIPKSQLTDEEVKSLRSILRFYLPCDLKR